MRSNFLWNVFAVAALGFGLVLPYQEQLAVGGDSFWLEAKLASTTAGNVQIYYDAGLGFNERNSSSLPLAQSAQALVYRLPIPAGSYAAMRFDPIDRDGTVTIAEAAIVDHDGRRVRELPFGLFRPLHQIHSLRTTSSGLEAAAEPGADDPQLLLTLDPPVHLGRSWTPFLAAWFRSGALVSALLGLGIWGIVRLTNQRPAIGAASGWFWARPGRLIAAVAAFSAVASSYPVVFLGKSFVSPNYGATLLYDGWPTLPGYRDSQISDVKGSDIGAILWQQVPYSMVQHRALLRDREIPVWDRYVSAGAPLLGQGQSMFGDPLHFLVIAANGAAWAWDLKYLVAKWLLAAGLGLSVWVLTRHLGAAGVVACSAPFAGFFLYRVNHPAVFSFCYAPWILCAWLGLAAAERRAAAAGWALLLVLADGAVFNSGTVKEAYVLLLTLNLAGAFALIGFSASVRSWLTRLAVALAASALALGLYAPMWWTFLETLRDGWTTSNFAAVAQIQPALLLGAFDEVFYRPLNEGSRVFNPSGNLLLLGGVVYFLAALRNAPGRRAAIWLGFGALVPLAFAFGLIPPVWIARTPFLGNVLHIDNTFSCALILICAVLAGAGFAAASRRLATADGIGDLWACALLLFVLIFGYVGFAHAAHRANYGPGATVTVYPVGQQLPVPAFVWGYLAATMGALLVLALIGRRALRGRAVSLAQICGVVLCAFVLLGRGGQQAGVTSWPDFVFRPAIRTNFHARSESVAYLQQAAAREPSRAIGVEGTLNPGWNAAYGIEGITGPDAVMNVQYRELTAASPLEQIWGWRLYLSRTNLKAAKPFLDFLNVRYFADGRGAPAELGADLQLVRRGDLDLYESRTAWPRAFFATHLRPYHTAAELMDQILKGEGRPFAAVQDSDLVPNSVLGPMVGPGPERAVIPGDSYHMTEDSTEFSISAPAAGLVVLSEVFWSGYAHVRVDGQSEHAYRVNHAFIGVPVAAGRHRIVVHYRPRRFDWTLGAAGFSALLLVGGICLSARRDGAFPD